MQVDPINPKLKPPGTKRLKLKYDKPLSSFAFKLNLHHYTEVAVELARVQHSLGGIVWTLNPKPSTLNPIP